MPLCPTCGHENAEGSRFCSACGAALSDPGSSPPAASGETSSGPATKEAGSSEAWMPPMTSGEPSTQRFPPLWFVSVGCLLVACLLLTGVIAGVAVYRLTRPTPTVQGGDEGLPFGFAVYRDPAGRFTFRYPADWGLYDEDPDDLAVELPDPEDPDLRDAWFLLEVVELEVPKTPAEYIAELKAELEAEEIAGLEWLDEGSTVLGGQRAYYVLLRFQPEDQDVPRKIRIYAAASGQSANRIYDIWIAGATEELFDAHLDTLEAILNSLELE